MMRRRTKWGLLAALASLLASTSCTDQKTILLVEIYLLPETPNLMARQFLATVTAGLDTKAFMLPPDPAAADIPLPASFTLTLDQSRTGPLTISIDAHDVTGSTVGFGTTTMEHLALGGQTVIPVGLSAGADTTDGGADAGADVAGEDAAGDEAGKDAENDASHDASDAKGTDGGRGLDAGAE